MTEAFCILASVPFQAEAALPAGARADVRCRGDRQITWVSLVVDGPSQRSTEYDGSKEEPAGWWEAFWQHFETNTGLSRQQARDLLQSLGACARNCP